MREYYLEIKSDDGRLLETVEFKSKSEHSAKRKSMKEAKRTFALYPKYKKGIASLWDAKFRSEMESIRARWELEHVVTVKALPRI